MTTLRIVKSLASAQPSDAQAVRNDNSPPFSKRLMLKGGGVIVFFLMGLSLWSFFAPIESAVIAQGLVSVDSSRKTIQHLEGGIVEEILVHDGDKVQAGDVLIRLQDTYQISQRNQLRAQYIEALATAARLLAERDEKSTIVFPTELTKNPDKLIAQAAIEGQRSIFASRKRLQDERLAALAQRVTGFGVEIDAIRVQIKSGEKQMNFISEELILLERANKLKLVDKPRLLELKRKKAEIEANISEMQISKARAEQGILESRLNMTEMQVTIMKEVEEELRTVNARAYELRQQLIAAEDVLRRMAIKSAIDGTVVGLKVHTVGGVISAGEALLDIVPSHDELIVEASIDLQDIDQVQPGMPAHVELTSFNHRSQKPIDGEVKMVSADRLIDPITGLAYYRARIALSKQSLKAQNTLLQPGMGAEVLIRTGARTPVEYLLMPITRSLGRALRES